MSMKRRDLLKSAGVGAASLVLGVPRIRATGLARKPNLVYVFADQWRAEATGYAGNKDVRTPNLDRLAGASVNFQNAVSCCPVCSPYRASLLTGQYPLTHGVFLNDVPLRSEATTLAEVYQRSGYQTAYIGKWHLDGNRRSAFIPRERRQGFEFWKVLSCTHAYNNSFYYGDENVRAKWDGYDAVAQTREAQQYIRDHADGPPFALVLSWGPPHDPYGTAPEVPGPLQARPSGSPTECAGGGPGQGSGGARRLLRPHRRPGRLRRRAPADAAGRRDRAGHDLRLHLRPRRHARSRTAVRTSSSPGTSRSACRFCSATPPCSGTEGRTIDLPINTPDIMPTLLGLSGICQSRDGRRHRFLPHPDRQDTDPGLRRTDRLPVALRPVDAGQRRPGVPGRAHPPVHLRPRPQGSLAALRQRARSRINSTICATSPNTRPSRRTWTQSSRRGSRTRRMSSSPAGTTSRNGATRWTTPARSATRTDSPLVLTGSRYPWRRSPSRGGSGRHRCTGCS